MKEIPTDDPLFRKGDSIRADGRKLHNAYLFEVKKPDESKYPGDDYKLRATIPADEAFRPLKEVAIARWSTGNFTLSLCGRGSGKPVCTFPGQNRLRSGSVFWERRAGERHV